MSRVRRNRDKKIGVIGTQSSTMNCIKGLMRAGYGIDYLITLPPNLSKNVADYQDLRGFAANQEIPLAHVKDYSMKTPETRDVISQVPLDLIIVVGWQRLIPEWLLMRTPLGIYGMHGSSLPLPKGRGRSPLNWSILQHKDRFYTYLFRYDPGIDSGDIIAVQRFDICLWDTIRSLQHKNTVSQYLLLQKNLPKLLTGKANPIPQMNHVAPSYYPKREFEDGAINWHEWTARDVYALIRAVGRPYPGAYTMIKGQRVMLWQAAPFDSCIHFPDSVPGKVVEVFTDGTFVVQCFVDTLLVLEYETTNDWFPEVGDMFEYLTNKSWLKLAHMRIEEESHGH